MDNSGQNSNNSKVITDTTTELAHITQEMYKKNFELAEKNKTLLILQRINDLILSSITQPTEIARLVTSLLVTQMDFQIVCIYLHEKEHKNLKMLSCSGIKQEGNEMKENKIDSLFLTDIPMSNIDNLIIQTCNERKSKEVCSMDNVLNLKKGVESLAGLYESKDVKCYFIYPLMVRAELIGAMVFGLKDDEHDLTEYKKDLINRISETIGIALDNSLLYTEVQANNEKLKALDKLKDEFVSLASHELRTPMTAIKSYIWMTLTGHGGELSEKQKFYLDRAYSSVDRLIKLVNDMLNISRIESGRLTLDIQPVFVEKIVQEVIEEVSPRAQELEVNIILQPGDDIPQVLADSDKIKEVLFNLIGNSLKFTSKGGSITISFIRNGDFVETKISDTGVGIEAENLPKLFQKFGLLPGSYITNQPVMGTGLGLYISRSIIELHKGKIWTDSEGKGKGAQFTFSLKIYHEDTFKKLPIDITNDTEKVQLIHTQL